MTPHSLPRECLKPLSKPICLSWQCSELVYTCIFSVWISALRLQKDCVASLLHYINIPERTKIEALYCHCCPQACGQVCAVALLYGP